MDIKVVVETKCGLERTLQEAERVLMFRGKVVGYLQPKATPDRIQLMVHVAETWKLDDQEKFEVLKIWVFSKFRTLFKVTEVTKLNLSEKIARDANLVMI